MGLNSRDYERKTYVGIIGGKFATKADANTPNAVKRYSEKKKEDVWELLYNDITGNISEMKVQKGSFGDEFLITISDVDEKLLIQIPAESKYFVSFCEKIENVNLNQEVKLVPYSFDDKEKINPLTKQPYKIIGMNIYQTGHGWEKDKAPKFYTKEEPKGKPQYVEGGTEMENKIAKLQIIEFFKKMINNIGGNIVTAQEVHQEMCDTGKNEGIADAPMDDSSDLPFKSPYFQKVPMMIRRRYPVFASKHYDGGVLI